MLHYIIVLARACGVVVWWCVCMIARVMWWCVRMIAWVVLVRVLRLVFPRNALLKAAAPELKLGKTGKVYYG